MGSCGRNTLVGEPVVTVVRFVWEFVVAVWLSVAVGVVRVAGWVVVVVWSAVAGLIVGSEAAHGRGAGYLTKGSSGVLVVLVV
jgi:hypothetical protein